MRIARLRISDLLLAQMINLPAGTRILDADATIGEVELLVTHDDLDDVKIYAGEEPPCVTPSFRTHPATSVEFVGWGQSR